MFRGVGLQEIFLKRKSSSYTKGRRGGCSLSAFGSQFLWRQQLPWERARVCREVVACHHCTVSLFWMDFLREALHLKPGPQHLLALPSVIPNADLGSNLQADSPDMDSGKSWRVSAGIGWESSPCWCKGWTPAGPRTVPSPPSPAISN